ncbi:MAG: hypothetical protein J7L14_00695 [Candidatus Diapherotrites archaeon]|nr:hypothetical protein [Candidatus Diapherotrites archaeon]
MAEEKSEKQDALPKFDTLYSKIANYVSAKVGNFVAFLFFIFTLGVVFGAVVVQAHPGIVYYAILFPAILGLVAYYNRAFATGLFIIFVALILLF